MTQSFIFAGPVKDASSKRGDVDLTSGLIGHYPFDGDAMDASGNGYNGTPYYVNPTDDRFYRV
mgnify:CR=1 FL=1